MLPSEDEGVTLPLREQQWEVLGPPPRADTLVFLLVGAGGHEHWDETTINAADFKAWEATPSGLVSGKSCDAQAPGNPSSPSGPSSLEAHAQ